MVNTPRVVCRRPLVVSTLRRLVVLAVLFPAVLLTVYATWLVAAFDISAETLRARARSVEANIVPSRIAGADGRSFDAALEIPLSLSPERIPALVAEAFITQEDQQFRWHPGVNPLALGRAAKGYALRLMGQPAPVTGGELADFLSGLGTAWQAGEVRATHRARLRVRRYWRSRVDPFVEVSSRLRSWLEAEPDLQATDLLARLQDECPGRYPDKLLRTLQRRVRDWRREIAHRLVFGPSAPGVPPGSSEDAGMPEAAPSESATTTRRPVDLMDDAGASPTAPQAPSPQPRATMIAR